MRLYFQNPEGEGPEQYEAWIVSPPEKVLLTRFVLARGVADKVLVASLHVGRFTLFAVSDLPGAMFCEGSPYPVRISCAWNTEIVLRLKKLEPISRKDCATFLEGGRTQTAVGWLE